MRLVGFSRQFPPKGFKDSLKYNPISPFAKGGTSLTRDIKSDSMCWKGWCSMKRFVLGLIFLIFGFHITFFEKGIIEFLPDFVGYILICRGFIHFNMEEMRFRSPYLISLLMAVVTAITFVMDLIGATGILTGNLEITVGIVMEILKFYVIWGIIRGIVILENKYAADFRSRGIKKLYVIMVLTTMGAYLFTIGELTVLIFISTITYYFVVIMLIYFINRIKHIESYMV